MVQPYFFYKQPKNMSSIYPVFFFDFKSVLIINPLGKLRRIFTPFNVVKIYSDGCSINHVYIVDEVQSTKDDRLIYIINDKPYFHSEFEIIVGIW